MEKTGMPYGIACRDFFFKRGQFQVKIKGFLSLPEDLRKYCETMLKIFDEIHNENPNVVFEFVS